MGKDADRDQGRLGHDDTAGVDGGREKRDDIEDPAAADERTDDRSRATGLTGVAGALGAAIDDAITGPAGAGDRDPERRER